MILDELKYILNNWELPDREDKINARIMSIGNINMTHLGLNKLESALRKAIGEIERLQKEINELNDKKLEGYFCIKCGSRLFYDSERYYYCANCQKSEA